MKQFDGITQDAAKTPEDVLAPVATEKQAQQTPSELERASKLMPVLSEIYQRHRQGKDARSTQDALWLASTNQWRGNLSPEEQAAVQRARERNLFSSSAVVKITKTKTTAAQGQILDIIFDGDNIPIRIEPTPVPDGAADIAYIAPGEFPVEDVYGFPGDGKSLQPGTTHKSALGGAYTRLKQLLGSQKVIEGQSPDAQKFPMLTPAEKAADKMEKTILDQLEEGHFKNEVRSAVWECCVLGTGVLKGPETIKQVTNTWVKNEQTGENEYQPNINLFPETTYVSCWNIYPDPSARRQEDMQWVIQRHLLNRMSLSALKNKSAFDTDAIDRLLYAGPLPRTQETWENQIRDVNDVGMDNRYEVLEYWGYLERSMVEALSDYVGHNLEEGVEQFQVNIWVSQNEILRAVINPFVPQRIPYYFIPYEEHTQQVWGISIPENMRDSQQLMNNHARMWIDNLALAGNCIFEVNENYLTPGQDLTMYPGKIIRTNNGAPGQSIFSIDFKSTAQEHMAAYDKARQIADETTGQPSYAHGGATTTGATRTASGMSMLMSAAAGNIRQVVKNWDEYCFSKLGEAYFNWNMQMNSDAEIKGDVRIVAGGTASLMRREVMSQRLLQYAQAVGGNPAIAPKVNWDYWNRELAKTLNLDPDKLTNDDATAMLVAQMMGAAQGQGQAPTEGSGQGGAQDQTGGGGGQTNPGTPTAPGEPQFSGNNAPK